jgi:hypothetical protein
MQSLGHCFSRRLVPFQLDDHQLSITINAKEIQTANARQLTLPVNDKQVNAEDVRRLLDPILQFFFQMVTSKRRLVDLV